MTDEVKKLKQSLYGSDWEPEDEDDDHGDDCTSIEESEKYGLEDATQEYTSANTSINSAKLPAIFNMVNFNPETINLDYGGGRFDNATKALENKGVTNLIYDPYNRSAGHNKDVIDTIRKNGGADTATCSNVLNVIKEPSARRAVIRNIYNLLKNDGVAYFTVYEGTGKGNEGSTKSGYQLNRKTADYIDEISSIFPSVNRRGKLIIASKETTKDIIQEHDHNYVDIGAYANIDYSNSLFDPNEKDPAMRALNMVKEYCNVSIREINQDTVISTDCFKATAYQDVIDFIQEHQNKCHAIENEETKHLENDAKWYKQRMDAYKKSFFMVCDLIKSSHIPESIKHFVELEEKRY